MKRYEVYHSVTINCKTIVGAESEKEAIKKVNQGKFHQWHRINDEQHFDAHAAKEVE